MSIYFFLNFIIFPKNPSLIIIPYKPSTLVFPSSVISLLGHKPSLWEPNCEPLFSTSHQWLAKSRCSEAELTHSVISTLPCSVSAFNQRFSFFLVKLLPHSWPNSSSVRRCWDEQVECL